MSSRRQGALAIVASVVVAATLCAQQPRDALTIEREFVLRGSVSHSLAWSPDGKWLASGGDRGEVLVVDAGTGDVAHELLASDYWVGALIFSPDNRTLFVGGRELTRWDLATGKRSAHVAHGHPRAIALSHDGAHIANVGDNATVEVRRAAHLELERTLAVPDETAIDALAFDRDGARIAVGKLSGHTYVCTLAPGAAGEIAEQPPQLQLEQSLAYLDDNRLVRLDWRGQLLGFTSRTEPVGVCAWGMSVNPAARLCLTWNGECVRAFTPAGPSFVVQGGGPAAIHADGASWVRAGDGKLEFHHDAELVRTLPLAHRARPGAAAFVGDSRHIAIEGPDGTHVFDLRDGAAVCRPLPGSPIAYSGGNELVLWRVPNFFHGEKPGTLSFWSIAVLRAGKPGLVRESTIPWPKLTGPFVSFSSDGRYVAIGNTVRDALQPDVVLWRAPDKYEQTLHPLPGGRAAWTSSYLSDGLGGGTSTLQLLRADGTNGPECDCRGYLLDWSVDGSHALLKQLGSVHVLDTRSNVTSLVVQGIHYNAKWVGDDHVLLLGEGGRLELVNLSTRAVATLALPGNFGSIEVAADGKHAAVVLEDRVIVVRVGDV